MKKEGIGPPAKGSMKRAEEARGEERRNGRIIGEEALERKEKESSVILLRCLRLGRLRGASLAGWTTACMHAAASFEVSSYLSADE